MRDRLKDLVELASIDLAYARAEIAIMARAGDEKARIANHMDSAEANLQALMQMIDAFKTEPSQLRVQNGRRARATTQKSA
jgi:hypothetical protein